jgi:hypothetical protein
MLLDVTTGHGFGQVFLERPKQKRKLSGNWTKVAKNRVERQTLVNTIMKLRAL